MGPVLVGSLSIFDASRVVEMLLLSNVSGTLTLEADRHYRLAISAGRLTGIEVSPAREGQSVEELALEALRESEGGFSFSEKPMVGGVECDLDLQALIRTVQSHETARVPTDVIRSEAVSDSPRTPEPEHSAPAPPDTAEHRKENAAAEASRLACLIREDADATAHPIFADELTIGRSSESGIPIVHPSVSKAHARVSRSDDGVVLEDLGSSNGTFVNGRRVDRVLLSDGDRVRLGQVIFTYMVPAQLRKEEEP